MRHFVINLLQLYQMCASPYIPGTCRYTPTCSNYGMGVVGKYGVIKGTWLVIRRLSRCHPLGATGYDPVP